ncbi:MAG: hypothetical protein KJO31_08425 [Gammaproteobacteria bacterium]|nr:hypothetical protein [Gammaproteobacteria bacterium]
MSHESDNPKWPPEAGDPKTLPTEMQPPAGLEDRVVNALQERRLLDETTTTARQHVGWRAVRASLAAAACVALVAVGFFLGKAMENTVLPVTTTLTGGETDLYALLLYETDGYDRAIGAEAMQRYSEYSNWVAVARQRGQFVTGEDLEVDRGWLLVPSADGVEVERSTSIAANAPLSGMFLVRATDADDVLDLARELPHIKHGGQVLVQKTIPTDVPPQPGE